MNKIRRATLSTILEQLERLWDELETVLTDEELAYDNLPDGIQDSQRGESMAAGIESLECALVGIEQAKDEIETIMNGGSN